MTPRVSLSGYTKGPLRERLTFNKHDLPLKQKPGLINLGLNSEMLQQSETLNYSLQWLWIQSLCPKVHLSNEIKQGSPVIKKIKRAYILNVNLPCRLRAQVIIWVCMHFYIFFFLTLAFHGEKVKRVNRWEVNITINASNGAEIDYCLVD